MKLKLGEYNSLAVWLAGNEGVANNMETTIMGYIGTPVRIHSFTPS